MNFLVISVFRQVEDSEAVDCDGEIQKKIFPLKKCCIKSIFIDKTGCCDRAMTEAGLDSIIEHFCAQEKFKIVDLFEENSLRKYVTILPIE